MTLSWCLSLLEKMILERLVRTMAKIAFVFPGQGAQVVGMGKDVYDHSAKAKEVFDRASEAVDLDLKALCFEENDNTCFGQQLSPDYNKVAKDIDIFNVIRINICCSVSIIQIPIFAIRIVDRHAIHNE